MGLPRKEIIVCIILSVLLYLESNGNAQTLSLPTNVSDKLTENVSDMNPISITWTQRKTTSRDRDALLSRGEKLDGITFFEQRTCTFMWQDGCAYFIVNHHNNARYSDGSGSGDSIQENSYNGEIFFVGTGNKEAEFNTPRIGLFPNSHLKDPTKHIPAFSQQYTAFLGYKFPNIGRELGEMHLSYIHYLIGIGRLLEAREVNVDGEPLFFVSVEAPYYWDEDRKRVFLFWLTPKYNYAVKRMEIKTLENQVAYSIDNMDFAQVSQKRVYLPQRTVVQCHVNEINPDSISATPLFTEIYTVSDVSSRKINDGQFNLQAKYTTPGTRVGDRVLQESDAGLVYVMPANPADLDRVIEAARTGGNFVPTPITSTAAIVFRWLLVAAGIVLVVYVLLRRFVKQ